MTLKVGDKVRPLDLLKSIHFPDLSVVEVLELREGRYSVLAGKPGNYLNAVWAKPAELEKIEDPTPKFKVGDRVRCSFGGGVVTITEVGNETYGPDAYRARHDAGDYGIWKESELTPLGVPFKLERGDKVVNRKTGREGFYFLGLVYDTHPPYGEPVSAKAIEAWEQMHPGTYDLIKKDAPW